MLKLVDRKLTEKFKYNVKFPSDAKIWNLAKNESMPLFENVRLK